MIEATPAMVAYCFGCVFHRLHGLTQPPAPRSLVESAYEAPVFVCFKKVSNGDLRGCIGSFASAPLIDQLSKQACSAAFHDSRFAPIQQESELAGLACTLSILHTFEAASCWDDWKIGVHGIQIKFHSEQPSPRDYRATFLPRVAKEQGWDHHTTLARLIRKSGYEGAIDEMLLKGLTVQRYQESTCTLSFSEALPEEALRIKESRRGLCSAQ